MTYANVVATLALFLSLCGSSYAVSQITSKDVKNRSLKGGDLKRNTLTGTEVNESTLGTVSLATVAGDAQSFGGQPPAFYQRASRTQFGRAPLAPADPASEQTVIASLEMNAELRTSSVACPGSKLRLRLRKSSGPYVSIYELGTPKGTLVGGQDVSFCSTADNFWDGALTDAEGRTLFFECLGVDNAELRCLGTKSEG